MRNLLPLAREMRRDPTEAERKLWSILRAGRMNGAKFKRQEQIGNYIVDFVCFRSKLIVEADGSQHADSERDRVRDVWLTDHGFRVLRFWNNDILGKTDGVADTILAALTLPHPSNSPTGGEGL